MLGGWGIGLAMRLDLCRDGSPMQLAVFSLLDNVLHDLPMQAANDKVYDCVWTGRRQLTIVQLAGET